MEVKEEQDQFKQMNHPIKKHAYAVTTGYYVGEILVFVEKTEDSYNFISIPKNINRHIPVNKFQIGLNESIVEHVEEIPDDVFSILEKQFEFNNNKDK
jgi:hypothetical protein